MKPGSFVNETGLVRSNFNSLIRKKFFIGVRAKKAWEETKKQSASKLLLFFPDGKGVGLLRAVGFGPQKRPTMQTVAYG